MRTTVACQRCRRSKIKCHHDGNAPCSGCAKRGLSRTCVLTSTIVGASSVSRGRRANQGGKEASSNQDNLTQARITVGVDHHSKGDNVSHVFASLDRATYVQAAAVFRVNFPEVGFIHPPDLGDVDKDHSEDEKFRHLAMVAVAANYMGDDYDDERRPLKSLVPRIAALVSKELERKTTAQPTICTIQTFLFMALYEWGTEGRVYHAWMYTGIAARMAQGFRGMRVVERNPGPRPPPKKPLLSEAESRTLWTCFVFDKLLSCGRQRPSMMRIDDVDVHLPLGENDYVLGTQTAEPILHPTYIQSSTSIRQQRSTMDHHFGIIVRGLSIWSQIHGWVVDGGRRLPGMTDPENCPWRPNSKWAKLLEELNCWRKDQEIGLRYPETKVAAHVHLRQAETFAYINLIYYLSVIFLRREFIPFLPIRETGPRGPIDPPLYPDDAPSGWWIRNSNALFDSSSQITYLMRDMRELNCALLTPFAGICVFTAAGANLFLASFPFMNGERDESIRQSLADANIEELRAISKVCKLAEEWLRVTESIGELIQRMITHRSQFVGRSRDDYIPIETSMNLAPLGCLRPPPMLPPDSPTATTADQPLSHRLDIASSPPSSHAIREPASASHGQGASTPLAGRQANTAVTGRGLATPAMTEINMTSDHGDEHEQVALGASSFDSDALLGQDLRLWSFWDDPYLTSWDGLSLLNSV